MFETSLRILPSEVLRVDLFLIR